MILLLLMLLIKGAEIVEEMSQCNGIKSLLFNYLRLILHSITFVWWAKITLSIKRTTCFW